MARAGSWSDRCLCSRSGLCFSAWHGPGEGTAGSGPTARRRAVNRSSHFRYGNHDDGLDAVGLHRRALSAPAATVLLVALAGTLASSRTRRERLVGVAVAAAALLTVVIASTTFLDRFGSDPLLVEAPPVRWVALPSNPIRTFDVPLNTSTLDVSPGGEHLALRRHVTRDGEYSVDLQVGRIGGC